MGSTSTSVAVGDDLPPGSWELNGVGRLLARGLGALSACAGVRVVGRKPGGTPA